MFHGVFSVCLEFQKALSSKFGVSKFELSRTTELAAVLGLIADRGAILGCIELEVGFTAR